MGSEPEVTLSFYRMPWFQFLAGRSHVATVFQMPTDAYHPIITNLTEERKCFQRPGSVLRYLQNVSLSLPNKSLSEETALNLTQVRLLVPLTGGLGLIHGWNMD